jgi:hypothetical protein
MYRLSIENAKSTQIKVDSKLYYLPYRLNAVIDYKNVIAFQCYPDFDKDNPEEIESYKKSGRYSLFIFSKENQSILWKYAQAETISIEIPEEKTPKDFITPEHYKKYIEKYGGKELITVYSGEFKYRIDANTGEVYDKNESR